MYHQHDVMIYPTYGEGFGFIPFQALATGMPVISTHEWADYKKYLGPLKLNSTLIDSPCYGYWYLFTHSWFQKTPPSVTSYFDFFNWNCFVVDETGFPSIPIVVSYTSCSFNCFCTFYQLQKMQNRRSLSCRRLQSLMLIPQAWSR